MYLLNGSATTVDGSAVATVETCKVAHYARPGNVYFDERSFKRTTLAVESFGRPGKSGGELVYQIPVSLVGDRPGGPIARKGIVKERLLQVISEQLRKQLCLIGFTGIGWRCTRGRRLA